MLDFILHIDDHLITLIENYGTLVYGILFLIIFIETGIVIMPFLPGDSLLFIAGTLAATGILNIWILFVLFLLAAIIGDTVNYWIGSYMGKTIAVRFLKKEHLNKTENFYNIYGAKAIIIARFIPIIRTFMPFVGGIGKMHYRIFALYNIIGGLLWVTLFIFAGYFFGNIPIVRENLTLIIIGIVILSFVPPILEFAQKKLH